MPKIFKGEQNSGHTCPRCRLRLRTLRVIPKPDEVIERVKQCPKCSFRRVFVDTPKGAKPTRET